MPFVSRTGNPRLYYEVDDFTDPWRDAPYLILQHGYGRYSRFWYSWVPYLSRFFRVVRPDMRGFGRSREGFDLAQGFNTSDLVADVVAIIDDLGVDNVHYCGEAFGGTLGLPLAAKHPTRIRTLQLVAAPVFLPQKIQQNYALGEASWFDALRKHGVKKWAAATNTIARFPPQVSAEFLDWYSDELAIADVETLIGFSTMCANYDMTDCLSAITAPVLGVYPRSRPEQVALLREHVRKFSVVELPTDNLMIYNVYPRICAEAVLHFAAQHDGTVCRE
jgi:3-oxoadipate enol-lactonase